MNVLVVNTAGDCVEIALKAGEKTEYYINEKKEMASVVLLSVIEKMTAGFNIGLADIDYFAGVIGPGSFTGIRIGISTIRAFCQSLNKKAVAVNRLRLLAYNNKTDCEYIVTVVDGQNGVSYVSVFSADVEVEYLKPSCIKTTDLKNFLDLIDEPFLLVSDTALVVDGYQAVCLPKTIDKLISFAEHKISRGETVEYTELEPLYIRKAQAERLAGEI